jgi:hypothetical protein
MTSSSSKGMKSTEALVGSSPRISVLSPVSCELPVSVELAAAGCCVCCVCSWWTWVGGPWILNLGSCHVLK